MRKIFLTILCCCAFFAFVVEGKVSNRVSDFSIKTCAEKNDEEVRYGGPHEGFYLFHKTIIPFIK